MALYRFLFAPVLLAVAVVAGPRRGAERAPEPPRAEAPAAPSRGAIVPGMEAVTASHRVPAGAGRAVPRRGVSDR